MRSGCSSDAEVSLDRNLLRDSVPDELRERNRQTIRIDRDGEFDSLTFALRRGHHKPDPFRFQLFIGLIDIVDVESNRARACDF